LLLAAFTVRYMQGTIQKKAITKGLLNLSRQN
jgi:hypothetical protein